MMMMILVASTLKALKGYSKRIFLHNYFKDSTIYTPSVLERIYYKLRFSISIFISISILVSRSNRFIKGKITSLK